MANVSNLVASSINTSLNAGDATNGMALIGQQKTTQQISSSPGQSVTIQKGASPHTSATPPGQVLLKDVTSLVRLNIVSVPSGFTKLGSPVLCFPDDPSSSGLFPNVADSDLHLLFKYYLAVVPRSEQASGFSLIIDRRCDHGWDGVRNVFRRIVSLFPARVREIYLLHNSGGDRVSQLIDELLLDFDVYYLEDPAELTHYIDLKYIPTELGGQVRPTIENWLLLQEHVESFSFNARRIARRLAQFVGVLNAEDVNYRAESLREIASKNRNCYRRLRKELEDLTEHGLHMLKNLQRADSNVMQRLAVQVLCKQLDQAWTYFNRSWKMQDHVYVQYLELNTFQHKFREIANSFVDNERQVRDLQVGGNNPEEINAALDKIESYAQALAMESVKARELSKMGQELLADHNFAVDCVQPKCNELKMMCQKLDVMLHDKRRILHKFLSLMEDVEAINKWSVTATEHLDRDEDLDRPGVPMMTAGGNGEVVEIGENIYSQIRQIDYLLSKSRELKLRSRHDFEENYDEIKDIVSAQTLFGVDDALEQLETVTVRVIQRREDLRAKTIRSYEFNAIDNAGDRMINGGVLSEDASSNKSGNEIRDSNTHSDFSTSSSSHLESMKVRRENILSELVDTESKYVIDLNEVLVNYRDKLAVSNLTETRQRANTIFGNLDEIHDFHNSTLYPELERCGTSPASVAKVFITNCQTIKSLYSAYCQNMSASRQAVANLGGETTPTSILLHCQQEAGHQLPLSSYLLKPMQRLTKYQLLLKYLAEASDIVSGKVELDEALEELLTVVKVVNDSLHNITIKGLPSAAQPLGALVTHDIFTVTSENNKSALTGAQILLLRGNRGQRRHVFLYENHVVFAKVVSEKSQVYGFKFCLATASLGMSSVVKGDDKKIDLWLLGRSSDSYTLEAKTKKAKDEFASELRKVINRQKERNKSTSRGGSLSQKYALQNPNHVNEMQIHPNSGPQQAAYYDTASTTCSGESGDSQAGDRLSRNVARSRSLESGRVHAPLRSRSVDCAADRNSPIDDDDLGVDEDEDAESGGSTGAGGNPRTRMHRSGGRYIALADYMALTSREIDLTEDEVVELIKVGCAGWWYVRLTTYPYPEGWTPSTYLEKLHERN